MQITSIGNFKFKITSRKHQLVSDQSDSKDEEMTPQELFIGKLGACMEVYAESYYNQANIPTDGMTIDIEWKKASNPSRIGEIKVDMKIQNSKAKVKKEVILKAAESCLIHNTLRYHPKVITNLDEP